MAHPEARPPGPSAPGPWLSAAYVVILLFGLVSAAFTLPFVQQALTTLRGALH